jgi:hypothetical protein
MNQIFLHSTVLQIPFGESDMKSRDIFLGVVRDCQKYRKDPHDLPFYALRAVTPETTWRATCGLLQPPWTPHAVRL